MLMALSMVKLLLLAQDDQNEVQHHSFGHVMSLAPVLAAHDANGILNGTTAFIRSSLSKCGAHLLFFIM